MEPTTADDDVTVDQRTAFFPRENGKVPAQVHARTGLRGVRDTRAVGSNPSAADLPCWAISVARMMDAKKQTVASAVADWLSGEAAAASSKGDSVLSESLIAASKSVEAAFKLGHPETG